MSKCFDCKLFSSHIEKLFEDRTTTVYICEHPHQYSEICPDMDACKYYKAKIVRNSDGADNK